MTAKARNRIPPPSEQLEFARNVTTGTVHILCYVPKRGESGYVAPTVYASFAEGLAAMFTTPRRMLCGIRLRVGGADSFPAVWIAGDDFADEDLCITCVQALGDQQWRAFHADNRGRLRHDHDSDLTRKALT